MLSKFERKCKYFSEIVVGSFVLSIGTYILESIIMWVYSFLIEIVIFGIDPSEPSKLSKDLFKLNEFILSIVEFNFISLVFYSLLLVLVLYIYDFIEKKKKRKRAEELPQPFLNRYFTID